MFAGVTPDRRNRATFFPSTVRGWAERPSSAICPPRYRSQAVSSVPGCSVLLSSKADQLEKPAHQHDADAEREAALPVEHRPHLALYPWSEQQDRTDVAKLQVAPGDGECLGLLDFHPIAGGIRDRRLFDLDRIA